ncbi:hypothetical protein Ddc_17713 [Ditylenchus destructor]|nr:hypothetical protein Ddc_17713 [Ditylenchus destructor]
MSNSKPLPSFTFDVLYYLNRDQLERFSIVCRSLKNFIERYFHSKPYRIFDELRIRRWPYALRHNGVHWHPNRYHYSTQQFLAGQKANIDKFKRPWDDSAYYSFTEMRPFLGPTVRIKKTTIAVGVNSRQIEKMESISYLWRDGDIHLANQHSRDDFKLILNSPTILQCRNLYMTNTYFSLKNHKVLYTVKVIETCNVNPTCWLEFLEQPGVKPLIVVREVLHIYITGALDHLCKVI